MHISQFGSINQLRKSSLNSFIVGLIKAKVYWIMVRIGLFTAPVFKGISVISHYDIYCLVPSILLYNCFSYFSLKNLISLWWQNLIDRCNKTGHTRHWRCCQCPTFCKCRWWNISWFKNWTVHEPCLRFHIKFCNWSPENSCLNSRLFCSLFCS